MSCQLSCFCHNFFLWIPHLTYSCTSAVVFLLLVNREQLTEFELQRFKKHLKNYVFPFLTLSVVMTKSTWTGCSRVCLVADVPTWCVCFGWCTQGLVRSCSSIPETSSQKCEQRDLSAHTKVVLPQLSFFPCWFSFHVGCYAMFYVYIMSWEPYKYQNPLV